MSMLPSEIIFVSKMKILNTAGTIFQKKLCYSYISAEHVEDFEEANINVAFRKQMKFARCLTREWKLRLSCS